MKRQFPLYLLLGALALFGFGLYHLFELRYESGDIYPEYSSLRADPLGTMALYEALASLPGVEVKRDYSAENQLPRSRAITYLHLAASREDWSSMGEDLLREVEGFVSAGGRLVISFVPEPAPWLPPAAPATPPPGKKKAGPPTKDEQRKLKRTSPQTAWGFEFSRIAMAQTDSGGLKPVRAARQADLPLPDELLWHSPTVFTNLSDHWQPIYARADAPVMIERRLGLGSVVMATDSFFLSNEGLLKDRQPELLAWVVGPSRTVMFDEAHLGIVEQSGAAVLMHKYRLERFGLALLLLAALFIWQNATSFPPPLPQATQRGPLAGKEAAAGFTNLLRRNIPPADLLRVCFEEWTKSLMHARSHSIARVDAAQAVIESENARARTSRDPVRAYGEICAALKAHSERKNL